jgi:AcrR family transcriptional regulator
MNSKRTYNLGRRAETAADTRQRLVEATFALHRERGVSATSLRDIAERAGLSVGTAYHHFPTYSDAIRACGAHVAATSPLPSESIFEDVDAVEERIRLLVRELCTWYEQHPWFEHIRAERVLYPPIEEHMQGFERRLEELARTAARCTADEARTIAALTDVAVDSSLRRAGLTTARITNRIAEAVLAWLNRRRTR